jgi:protein arginine kinase activator
MTCEKCHAAEATVFLTQIIEGETRKIDLCEKCARQMGINNQTACFNLTDLLLKGAAVEPDNNTRSCPTCGFNEQELHKAGRLGCPRCYETFSDLIGEAIRNTQHDTRHTGKIPHNFQRQLQTAAQRDDLEKELDAAIKAENYEQAAQLRDRLKSLE